MPEAITFTLQGKSYHLSRAEVQGRLAEVVPEPVRQHVVLVDGREFPVKQALAIVLGLKDKPFNAHTARRYLAQLGFETYGEVRHRDGTVGDFGATDGRSTATPARASAGPSSSASEWATEEHVQALLISWLRMEGYNIVRSANTATKEHGIDVVAEKDGVAVGFEVKGYPSRSYADPRRADEVKKTSPTTQAGHWYSQATLAAMKLRSKQPSWRSAIALPDFARYRSLYADTAGSLEASGIELHFVTEDGVVQRAG